MQLDEPTGDTNGTVKGKTFFECADKFGAFVRPNELEVGDFPADDFDAELDEL